MRWNAQVHSRARSPHRWRFFFASCEVAKNLPALRGKPVITGKERGIVSACTI